MVVVNTQFYVQYAIFLRDINLHTRMYSCRFPLLLGKKVNVMNPI